MFNQKKSYILIIFFILLSGCSQNNINKTVVSTKNKPIVPKKKVIKKEKKQIVITKKKKKKIVKNNYKICSKYIKTIEHSSKYIKDEFDKGYFLQKDIVGAKAQIFLIESKSPSIFAKNINSALESYEKNYNLAKKNRCKIKKYKISPLMKIKNKIKTLEKQKEKK